MRKKHFNWTSLHLGALFGVSLFTCCIDDSEQRFMAEPSPIRSMDSSKEISPIDLIYKSIYISNPNVTRAGADFSVTPHVLNGDTVMYVVNYDGNGWDIFSSKLQAPMVLFHSDTGSINLSDSISFPEVFLATVNSMAEKVYYTEADDNFIDDSWATVLLSSSSPGSLPIVPLDSMIHYIPTDSLAPDTLQIIPNLGEGYWIKDTVTETITTIDIDHLVNDHWNQLVPYNSFIPYDPQNENVHGAVGCVAVATTQYLHYLHIKDGISLKAYSEATYDSNNNRYIFSNPSATLWDNLPCDGSSEQGSMLDSLALVLGYISSNVCYGHSVSGTPGRLSYVTSFLRDSCGLNYQEATYNYDYVVGELKSGYPVVVTASGSNNGNDDNHCFIIDSYRNQIETVYCYQKWVGTDYWGNPTNTFDNEGNPITFTYVMRLPLSRSQTPFYRMNLGRGNSFYDNVWVTAEDQWQFKPTYWYNVSSAKMLKRVFTISRK